MSERHLCGRCERVYNESEAKIEIREAPPNAPIREEGITKIEVQCCPYCGAPEHSYYPDSQWKSRFNLKTKVSTPYGEMLVSTVNLIIEHSGGFYETMVFLTGYETASYYNTLNSDLEVNICKRYWTKEEALRGHERIVNLLKESKFRLKPVRYQLVLEDEVNG